MISKIARRNKIKSRIRGKISGTAARPRMSVFRSNKGIYVQIIDDLAPAYRSRTATAWAVRLKR